MKRIHLQAIYPDKAIESIKWHLSMIGKPADTTTIYHILDQLVRNNPNFHNDYEIEETLDAFFKAIHYGSLELRNFTISAHTRLLNVYLNDRYKNKGSSDEVRSEKPDTWVYDPDEPLPESITRDKAKELLNLIAKLYHNDMQRVTDSNNFMHYVNKLKARYYE